MINSHNLHISNNMTCQDLEICVKHALLLGFHSTSSSFPISTFCDTQNFEDNFNSYWNSLKLDSQKPDDYTSALDHALPLPAFDKRSIKGLESVFEIGDFLLDKNLDLLADETNFKIVVNSDFDKYTARAVCDLAFRFGMETTKLTDSLISFEPVVGNQIQFTSSSICKMTFEHTETGNLIRIFGQGENLSTFVSFICENFPLQQNRMTWSQLLNEFIESLSLRNLDGQLSYAHMLSKQGNNTIAYIEPSFRNLPYEEMNFASFKSYKDLKPAYERTYDIPWEVDVFMDLMKSEIYPRIHTGDCVRIQAALSEEFDVRETLMQTIEKDLKHLGCTTVQQEIICAFKQGFSWIDDYVITDLQNTNTEKIEIEFKAFLKNPDDTWLDEDGAMPSYNSSAGKNEDTWFDIPIRFLQELYPIEDVLIDRLNLTSDNVVFKEYKGSENITYRVVAYDKEGDSIYENKYKTHVSERSYMNEYPTLGKVHPCTGYAKVYINDDLILDQRIQTDLELIWDIYQSEVLPDCRDYFTKRLGRIPTAADQPFFAKLDLQVEVSEPDYPLKSRQDMISSLDALHEDMYFVGSDYFKFLGEQTGENFNAPGLIYPRIKKSEGKPKFKVTLSDNLFSEMTVDVDGTLHQKTCAKEDVSAYISELTLEDNKLNLDVIVECPDPNIVESFAQLLESGHLSINTTFDKIGTICFRTSNGDYRSNVKLIPKPTKDLDINTLEFTQQDVIGYDQYICYIEQLKRVNGLEVYPIATSYLGRIVYAVEFAPEYEGYLSRTKRITHAPSEIINCRHHANEVSATNASFQIIKTLLTDEKYKGIGNRMNLTIIPVENTDGTAMHEELMQDNPNWIFHVARFNALGNEFFREHFNEDSIHTESRGLIGLWRRFLPDVIVDNHGVPSHEWDQQFSGYTSPSFKGFWLPRSILYGIYWQIDDERWTCNLPLNKAIEEVVADAILGDTTMECYNTEMTRLFEKYASDWMPKLFPASYFRTMINYWVPRKLDLENSTYFSYKFPWITTSCYTSEVADETAQGQYLEDCSKAHYLHNMATIDLLLKSQCVYNSSLVVDNNTFLVEHTRQRPLLV